MNTMKTIFPLFALLFLAVTSSSSAQPVTDATVLRSLEKQAKTMVDAFLKEDFANFARYVHPGVVKMMGGKKKVIKTLKEGMEAMRSEDLKITKYSLGEPSDILKAGKELQCAIPQFMVITSPTSRVEMESTLIAISSNNGKNWQFIDASDKDRETLKSLLPNLSDDLVIPEKKSSVHQE
jgi:hypothetical protein